MVKKLFIGPRRPRGRPKGSKGLNKTEKSQVRVLTRKILSNSLELKVATESAVNANVGQINGDESGHYSASFFDTIPVGDGQGELVGTDYNPKHADFTFQFWKKANTLNNMQLRILVVKLVLQDPSSDFVIGNLLDPNFAIALEDTINIYDVGSLKNPDYPKQYMIVKEVKTTINATVESGTDMVKTLSFRYKYPKNYVQRTISGAATQSGYRFIILASNGNRAASASTITALPEVAVNTGMLFNWAVKLSYTDA